MYPINVLKKSLSTTIAGILIFTFLFYGCNSTSSDNKPVNNGVSFDSGNIAAGDSYSYTFEKEGDIYYYCEIHSPDMQGVVHVDQSADVSGQDTVEMKNNQYQPSEITIQPNTTVVWINRDQVDHTVISGNPSSGSGGYGY